EEALLVAPGSVEVMHGLARALDLAGERARAVQLLEHANARAPSEPEPACDLAMALLEKGEDARAERVLAPVLEARPDHPRTNLYLGMALAKTDADRARGHLAKARQTGDAEVKEQAAALERVLAGEPLR
ncbi:tetratricopeptide repeat protein, partial [Pyxidicoccus fallax]